MQSTPVPWRKNGVPPLALETLRPVEEPQNDAQPRRARRIGMLPELFAVETTHAVTSRNIAPTKRTDQGALWRRPQTELRDVQMELEASLLTPPPLTPPATSSTAIRPPPKPTSPPSSEPKRQEDALLSQMLKDIIGMIARMETDRQTELDKERENRAAYEQKRQHEEEKRRQEEEEKRRRDEEKRREAEEAQRRKEEEERKKKEEAVAKEMAAPTPVQHMVLSPASPSTMDAPPDKGLPTDVRSALLLWRCLVDFKGSQEYRDFISTTDPAVKEFRVEIGKMAGSIPNRLAGTSTRLIDTYKLVKEKQALCAQNTLPFDAPFQAVLHALIAKSPDTLSVLKPLRLSLMYFYIKLCEVLIDNAETQVLSTESTVWVYAFFVRMCLQDLGPEFGAVWHACLFNRSTWLIPWASKDTEARKKTNEDLDNWCKKLAGLFRLRLAISVAQQNFEDTWTIVTRTLNRMLIYKHHPVLPYLVNSILQVTSYGLSQAYPQPFYKLVKMIETDILPGFTEIASRPTTWVEMRVPVTQAGLKVSEILNSQGRPLNKPDGYTLQATEADLDKNI